MEGNSYGELLFPILFCAGSLLIEKVVLRIWGYGSFVRRLPAEKIDATARLVPGRSERDPLDIFKSLLSLAKVFL